MIQLPQKPSLHEQLEAEAAVTPCKASPMPPANPPIPRKNLRRELAPARKAPNREAVSSIILLLLLSFLYPYPDGAIANILTYDDLPHGSLKTIASDFVASRTSHGR